MSKISTKTVADIRGIWVVQPYRSSMDPVLFSTISFCTFYWSHPSRIYQYPLHGVTTDPIRILPVHGDDSIDANILAKLRDELCDSSFRGYTEWTVATWSTVISKGWLEQREYRWWRGHELWDLWYSRWQTLSFLSIFPLTLGMKLSIRLCSSCLFSYVNTLF